MTTPTANPDSFPHPFTIAIDDSDTPWGGCTTHLAWIILSRLRDHVVLADYPLLVRLNPVVPRKTRGNAAVVIRGYTRLDYEDLYEMINGVIDGYMPVKAPGKSPGLALYRGTEPWRVPLLRILYHRGRREFIPVELAEEAAARLGITARRGSGLVGAILSLAALAPWDPYTFELIAYRRVEKLGEDRCVRGDPMDEAKLPPCEYANYDLVTGKLVAAPGGPDPVLIGFRGAEPTCLGKASRLLCEEPAGWVLYRTNQHTGAGPLRVPLRPYNYVKLRGVVAKRPRELPGGHVIVELDAQWGRVPLAFYRETGPLREVARMLVEGDLIGVEGGVVPRSRGNTIAVDVLVVYRLASEEVYLAPRCPRCGSRMKSMGKGKGYRCERCGYRDPRARPVRVRVPRPLTPGRYTPPVSSARHLTKYNWWEPAVGGGTPASMPVECVVSQEAEPPPLSYGWEYCKPLVYNPPVSSGA
ncbi:MAG: tRNA(Ile)(2)-agmatinylcytidine synthase [Desulfurococcales archaeon]|nr:tRNA(Ile)(2)-agmatinylcytidine synthase [Desulfurococcales archaeon]